MRIFTLICLLFLGSISVVQAQSEQYAIKLNGDTIRGKVQINPVRDNSRSMFFKGDDGFKGNISPLRYKYVYYSPKVEYRSVAFLKRKLFMQIVFEGDRVSLYNHIHHRDNSMVNSRVVIKSNGDALELSALTFKNQMKDFLDDCPEIVAKLDSKEYRFRNHKELFRAYNQCQLVEYRLTPVATAEPQQSTPAEAEAQTQVETQPQTPPTPTSTPAPSGDQSEQLGKLTDFKDYISALDQHQFKQDILDLLVDMEGRVKQNNAIPNYLWGSLNAMVGDNEELSQKAEELKNALMN